MGKRLSDSYVPVLITEDMFFDIEKNVICRIHKGTFTPSLLLIVQKRRFIEEYLKKTLNDDDDGRPMIAIAHMALSQVNKKYIAHKNDDKGN